MNKDYSLQRFIDAQEKNYNAALEEIKTGRKRTHWMWYVFPQIKGLGFSETAVYYSIKDIEEAAQFLQHPVLGSRLVEICSALLNVNTDDAYAIFGSPDDVKLKSSLTLFASLPGTNPVFKLLLQKFFNGMQDEKTLQIIGKA